MDLTSIEFIKNLAQHEFGGQYFDLHSDYHCEKLTFHDSAGLCLIFKGIASQNSLSLTFRDTTITALKFSQVSTESLTIDTLYRGRVEVDGRLIEVSDDGRAYFYLEFYGGQQFEFWARTLAFQIIS